MSPHGIAMSQWFLLVTAFGSLFMVAGKRYAEIMLFERTGAKIRSSLKKYSASYLRFVWATSAAILIMSYCLWAFEIRQAEHNSVWAVVSMVPFVIAVLRYAVDVDGGNSRRARRDRLEGPRAAGARRDLGRDPVPVVLPVNGARITVPIGTNPTTATA